MKPPFFILLLVFFLAVSCQSTPKSHLRPQELQGQKIAFYHMLKSNSDDDQEGDILCVFKNNGKYVGLLDGQEYDFGEYVYKFLKKPEQAEIIFVSLLMGEKDEWVYQLSYTTPYSGHWKLIKRGKMDCTPCEVGNFRYLR